MKEPDPVEQIDYGYGYKANNSPQQHSSQTVNLGGAVAIGFSLLAFGGILVASNMIPDLIQSRAQEAAAVARAKSDYAEREARVAIDQVQTMRIELAKKGIHIQLDDHQ